MRMWRKTSGNFNPVIWAFSIVILLIFGSVSYRIVTSCEGSSFELLQQLKVNLGGCSKQEVANTTVHSVSSTTTPDPSTGGVVVDFSAGNNAPPPRYLAAAAPYLKKSGVSIEAVNPPESRVVFVNNLGLYEGKAIRPTTSQNFLTQIDTSNVPATFKLVFSEPLESVSFTRPNLYADTRSGVTHPSWSAHALDTNGQEVASVSEGLTRSFDAKEPATYTLRAPGFEGIAAVRFHSDPQLNGKPFAAFSTLLIERLTIARQRK